MGKWKGAIELPVGAFFIIPDFTLENQGNAYKHLENVIWVEKIKEILRKPIILHVFLLPQNFFNKNNDKNPAEQIVSCFSAAILHFNLRNRFTETFSVNTCAVHAKTTAAACAFCAYGFWVWRRKGTENIKWKCKLFDPKWRNFRPLGIKYTLNVCTCLILYFPNFIFYMIRFHTPAWRWLKWPRRIVNPSGARRPNPGPRTLDPRPQTPHPRPQAPRT